MRATVSAFLLALALAVPASAADPVAPSRALAASPLAGGMLSIRNGDGLVRLDLVRGAVIGRLGSGTLDVQVPAAGDCDDLNSRVSGEEKQRDLAGEDQEGTPVWICRFSGKGIRFRLSGEDLVVVFRRARNLDLSAVGRGSVTFDGRVGSDGIYAVNSEEYSAIPTERKTIQLVAPRKQD